MHILIVKNAYQTKCTPSFNISTHPTTTHEFIGAYFKQIPPPLGEQAFPMMIQMRGALQLLFYKVFAKTHG